MAWQAASELRLQKVTEDCNPVSSAPPGLYADQSPPAQGDEDDSAPPAPNGQLADVVILAIGQRRPHIAFPIGFSSSRAYHSSVYLEQICYYSCSTTQGSSATKCNFSIAAPKDDVNITETTPEAAIAKLHAKIAGIYEQVDRTVDLSMNGSTFFGFELEPVKALFARDVVASAMSAVERASAIAKMVGSAVSSVPYDLAPVAIYPKQARSVQPDGQPQQRPRPRYDNDRFEVDYQPHVPRKKPTSVPARSKQNKRHQSSRGASSSARWSYKSDEDSDADEYFDDDDDELKGRKRPNPPLTAQERELRRKIASDLAPDLVEQQLRVATFVNYKFVDGQWSRQRRGRPLLAERGLPTLLVSSGKSLRQVLDENPSLPRGSALPLEADVVVGRPRMTDQELQISQDACETPVSLTQEPLPQLVRYQQLYQRQLPLPQHHQQQLNQSSSPSTPMANEADPEMVIDQPDENTQPESRLRSESNCRMNGTADSANVPQPANADIRVDVEAAAANVVGMFML
eukprot:TRINITY_DN9092_c0_g1_i1.p1 TRINITY_DN9092_c0_g1~~TRINITY_DN9092_c0_g1_i1.p1  ORF type:complete len:516 (-),score=92.12 TRINITY_DN9092_c0_g1_i1:278-1825(-)